MLTHHNHRKSIVDLRAHCWCWTCHGFGQTYPFLWHHTQYCHCPKSSLLCLVMFSHCHPGNHWSLHCVQFFLFQNVTDLESHCMSIFHTGCFHAEIRIPASSGSFRDLIAHFFLALNNTGLSVWTTLFIHSSNEGHHGRFHALWQLWIKQLRISPCRLLCGRKFSTLLGNKDLR